MPSSGVWPSIRGESWFGVESTTRPVPSWASHDQPLPNRFSPASVICRLSSSRLSKVSAIALASSPSGSPPPSGLIVSQYSEWFAWPPPLLRMACRTPASMRSRLSSTCSSGRPSHSVPAIAALRLST